MYEKERVASYTEKQRTDAGSLIIHVWVGEELAKDGNGFPKPLQKEQIDALFKRFWDKFYRIFSPPTTGKTWVWRQRPQLITLPTGEYQVHGMVSVE